MIKFFRKLKWLIKHQEELEMLLTKKVDTNKDDSFSLLGVPEFQQKYITDLLSDKK